MWCVSSWSNFHFFTLLVWLRKHTDKFNNGTFGWSLSEYLGFSLFIVHGDGSKVGQLNKWSSVTRLFTSISFQSIHRSLMAKYSRKKQRYGCGHVQYEYKIARANTITLDKRMPIAIIHLGSHRQQRKHRQVCQRFVTIASLLRKNAMGTTEICTWQNHLTEDFDNH